MSFSPVRRIHDWVLVFLLTSFSFTAWSATVTGAVSGQHNVGNDGSAQYTIPVNAAEGILGMGPDITVSYSSNGGNGLVGVGFDIAGIPAIHRCGTSIVRDGYADGVDFDSNDQYCLNGQRLVAVSGEYGADGTEYRTENDSIAKIISYGSEGTKAEGISEAHQATNDARNPQWFKVWTADGRIYEYGKTANSRSSISKTFVGSCPTGYVFVIWGPHYSGGYLTWCTNPANGGSATPSMDTETRTFDWSVNKVSDRFNNRMVYHYEGGSGEKRISKIEYNFSSSSGSAANEIRFQYESRPDIASGFFAGGSINQTKRLDYIATHAGNTQLRKLSFTYTNNSATQESLLQSVVECSASDCVSPTVFSWDDGASGFSATANNSGNDSTGWSHNPQVMDVNGDGRVDLVQPFNGKWRVMLSNGETYATQVATVSDQGWETARVLRYNNDLNDDILVAKNGKWHVLKGGTTQESTVYIEFGGVSYPIVYPAGPVFTEENTQIDSIGSSDAQLVDVNGDGRQDLLYKNGSLVYLRLLGDNGFGNPEPLNFPASYLNEYTKVADINGDGLQDLLVRLSGTSSESWSVYYSLGGAVFKHKFVNFLTSAYSTLKLMDFNGDGLPDILVRQSSNELIVRLNTGQEFSPATTVYTSNVGSTEWDNALVFDYDGNGRSDLLIRDGSYWSALRSSGTNFTKINTGISSDGWDRRPIASDTTGNGMSDLTLSIAGKWQVRPHNSLRPDYLNKITNGMGVETKFSYRFLTDPTDPDFYDPGEPADYPVTNIQNASYLVSKLEQSNGIGGYNSTDYQYKRLLIHQQGLGSLGFAEVTAINNDTQIKTTSTFNQDWQNNLHGAIDEVVTTNLANNTVLSHTVNTWQVDTMGSGSSLRYLRSPTETTVVKRDLNGAFLHKEVSVNPTLKELYYGSNSADRTMVSTVYDEYDVLLRTKTTDMKYLNDQSKWLMGMAAESKVETVVPNEPAQYQQASYLYDSVTGRKTEEHRINPDTSAILRKTEYGKNEFGQTAIDSFGHNLAITVSGSDFESRTSSVSYDVSGRYVVSETNALGHTVSHSYISSGAKIGLKEASTDANGLTTHFTYDNFGRVVNTTAFYGTGNAISNTVSFQDCSTGGATLCPTASSGLGSYYVSSQGQDGSESREYFDILGRTVRKAVLGFSISGNHWTLIDYQYNTNGHNSKVSEPYIYASGSIPWTTITYDALGRAVQTIGADGRIDTVQYNGLTTVSTVDTGGVNQQKTEQRDSLGNLVVVTDNAGHSVSYSYNSAGQMVTITPPSVSGLVVPNTVISYDALGRKISMSDPDKGVWHYTYNGLDQLITQQNARQEISCTAYDLLGRKVTRIDNYAGSVSSSIGQVSNASDQCVGDALNPNTTSWVYDSAPGAAIGSLHHVSSNNGYIKTLSYDSLGRNTQVSETIDGRNYLVNTSYDSLSRVDQLTYPGPSNRLQISHVYNSVGYLQQLKNTASGQSYYNILDTDARGNVIEEVHGNGLTTSRFYNRNTGFLETIYTGDSAATNNRQDLVFQFDKLGNLINRLDNIKGYEEAVTYDALNRLSSINADLGNGQTQNSSVTYDALGNITSKTGVGNYKYGSQCASNIGPHAVCQITGDKIASYTYDANGNMTSGDNRNISWSLFDKPLAITQGANSTSMSYGANRELITRTDTDSNGTSSTDFVGGIYEKVTLANGDVKERHYVGGHAIVTYTNRTALLAGTNDTRYIHKDHLGSVTVITDSNGAEIEAYSFDPWGKRRTATLSDLQDLFGILFALLPIQTLQQSIDALFLTSPSTNRGYTGHEQLDGVNLIHMGGRVYDADIGRFISADPFVDDKTNLQALNRYSYVQNNPLSYTDPSGYFLKSLFKKIGSAVKRFSSEINRFQREMRRKVLRKIGEVEGLSTVISIALNFIPGCQAWCSMAFNAAMTDANGGTIMQIAKGAAIAYVGGQISGAVTGAFDGAMSQAAASMVVGGALAKAQGGKFIDGVKGAVVGMAIGAAIGKIMESISQSPADATSTSQDPAGKDGANTSTPDSKLEGDLIDKAWAEADKLGVPHGDVPYEYTGSKLNCGGGAAWGCNYGGDRIKFGLGSATGTEGQRWFRGSWIKELRNDFEQALYVVTHERIHSTPMNQGLQSESALPYGYNKETHANKHAMKYLQKYRDSK